MTIEIRFKTENSLALTEKCHDVADFTRAIRSRKPEDLARHLSICPACRKVTLDSLSALVSDGDPWEPPAPIKKAARSLLRGLDSETKTVILLMNDSRILKLENADGAINERTGRAHLEFSAPPAPFQVSAEVDGGAIILKADSPDKKTDAGVSLRIMRKGESKGFPPRKLAAGAAWSGLRPNRYLLTASGKQGSFSVILDFRTIEKIGSSPFQVGNRCG